MITDNSDFQSLKLLTMMLIIEIDDFTQLNCVYIHIVFLLKINI